MIAQRPSAALVRVWLDDVRDPEIPAVSVVELGIVREIAWDGDAEGAALKITVTPTYSGCPATRVIARDIETALRARGIERVVLQERIAPPWTTDWISPGGRAKLQAYGIAPPAAAAGNTLDITGFVEPPVCCPRCGSVRTELTSRFGSTPCKALYRCNACREPFDHFKCH